MRRLSNIFSMSRSERAVALAIIIVAVVASAATYFFTRAREASPSHVEQMQSFEQELDSLAMVRTQDSIRAAEEKKKKKQAKKAKATGAPQRKLSPISTF